MGDQPRLLTISVVKDDNTASNASSAPPFWYTRSILASTLQIMGCKARLAFKISERAFAIMRQEELHQNAKHLATPPAIYHGTGKQASIVTIKRMVFQAAVCQALAEYRYLGQTQGSDLMTACRLKERKSSVTVLLSGTSGCGKSTLASLLASRLGITTVVSTDSIRHMMRSFMDQKSNPLLWSSTYHAGEHLDRSAIALAKSKRKASATFGASTNREVIGAWEVPYSSYQAAQWSASTSAAPCGMKSLAARAGSKPYDLEEKAPAKAINDPAGVSMKELVVQGYKAQSEMVMDNLDRLIGIWERRNESAIVEGVHLSLNFVMSLMKRHPTIVPFLIYISNEAKHLERFAVRAKYMTLDPAKNKYAKYIKNIRTIQDYMCKRAEKHLVPKVNNTNVDKSVAAIHATVFACQGRRESGVTLYDMTTNTVKVVHEEYMSQYAVSALSSKGMFQLIQRKGSSRDLMALVTFDGSKARAWPVLNKLASTTSQRQQQPSSSLQIVASPVSHDSSYLSQSQVTRDHLQAQAAVAHNRETHMRAAENANLSCENAPEVCQTLDQDRDQVGIQEAKSDSNSHGRNFASMVGPGLWHREFHSCPVPITTTQTGHLGTAQPTLDDGSAMNVRFGSYGLHSWASGLTNSCRSSSGEGCQLAVEDEELLDLRLGYPGLTASDGQSSKLHTDKVRAPEHSEDDLGGSDEEGSDSISSDETSKAAAHTSVDNDEEGSVDENPSSLSGDESPGRDGEWSPTSEIRAGTASPETPLALAGSDAALLNKGESGNIVGRQAKLHQQTPMHHQLQHQLPLDPLQRPRLDAMPADLRLKSTSHMYSPSKQSGAPR